MRMDSHGVPRKINRHVFKAIKFYMNERNGSRFREIYNFVRLYNMNLAPVLHLKEAVIKSLNNLQRFGLVKKDTNQKFRLRSGIAARRLRKVPKVMRKKATQKVPRTKISSETQGLNSINKHDTATTSRKRSSSTDARASKTSVIKRLRGDRRSTIENRKGMKVELPRARRHRSQSYAPIPLNRAEVGANESKINLAVAVEKDLPRGEDLQASDANEVTQSEEAISRTISQQSTESNSPNNGSNIRVKPETIVTESIQNSDQQENSSDPVQNSG